MIFNVTSGGGSGLSLRVLGGTTQPTNPREGTILVNTSALKPDYILSATQPGSPASGLAWIKLGSNGVSLPVDKKGTLAITLAGCAVWSGSTWDNVDAWVYTGGKWVQFSSTIVYLYNKGDLCTDITGGWKATAWPFNSGEYGRAPTVDYKDTYVNLSINGGGNNYSGVFEPINKIDLTGVKTILFKLNSVSSTSTQYTLVSTGVFNRGESNYTGITTVLPKLNTTDVSAAVDVSNLSGLQNVGVYLRAFGTVSVELSEIQLIR
nr:MAG TPA: hypothetical protein [Caudoviricetes sp.]